MVTAGVYLIARTHPLFELAPTAADIAAIIGTLTLFAAATIALVATGAAAQPRPSTLAMSCGQARALVASRGAIVLGTGAHTYDRYVVHTGFCPHDQTTEPAFEPTRDNPQCYIGNRCIARRSEQPTGDSGGGGGGMN
jgi:hypothetical protein